jgi:hypothetical protein
MLVCIEGPVERKRKDREKTEKRQRKDREKTEKRQRKDREKTEKRKRSFCRIFIFFEIGSGAYRLEAPSQRGVRSDSTPSPSRFGVKIQNWVPQ